MKILSRLLPFTAFVPFLALAQNPGELTDITNFVKNITVFMNSTLVPFIFAIAFLVFLWGMFKTFILGGHDAEAQESGKQLMMYSIAGFVVMVSLWGIVNLVARGFGFSGEQLQQIPDLPLQQN